MFSALTPKQDGQTPEEEYIRYNNTFNTKYNFTLDALNLGSRLIERNVEQLQKEFGAHLPNINNALEVVNPKFDNLFREALISNEKISVRIDGLIAQAKKLKTLFATDLTRTETLDKQIADLEKLSEITRVQHTNIEEYQTYWHQLSEDLALCSRKSEDELSDAQLAVGLDLLNSAGILDPNDHRSNIGMPTQQVALFLGTQCSNSGVTGVAHDFVNGWKSAMGSRAGAALALRI